VSTNIGEDLQTYYSGDSLSPVGVTGWYTGASEENGGSNVYPTYK